MVDSIYISLTSWLEHQYANYYNNVLYLMLKGSIVSLNIILTFIAILKATMDNIPQIL